MDDQKEEPGQLLAGFLESPEVVRRYITAKMLQRGREPLQQLLLPDTKLLLPLRQDPFTSQQLADHSSPGHGASAVVPHNGADKQASR